MDNKKTKLKILNLLAEKYPNKESIYERIIHLQSQLALPKGTEHFMSDIHGEYDAFFHIINNCSGVIREKVDHVFSLRLTADERAEFCTLIYYPKEKLEQLSATNRDTPEWYLKTISQLLELSKHMSYKYSASQVRGCIPHRYESAIVELMSTRPETDEAQYVYHRKLLDSIVQIDSGADFINAFSVLIKRLAVAHLHFVGDFFDRGSRPDSILNLLMQQRSVDIQWGNHDALWIGAALGSEVCIAAVIRNSLHYGNTDVLERGYGISLRPLATFAASIYPDAQPLKALERAITMIMFKLEGQLIKRNPDFLMNNRLMLEKINFNNNSITLHDGKTYKLNTDQFPTIDKESKNPYKLTTDEQHIIEDLKSYFLESTLLQSHVDYLYKKGSIYTICNGNLLFHACVLLNDDGTFREIKFDGENYSGKSYFDYAEQRARQAYLNREHYGLDFMYFLWCGRVSPTAGREMKTFERTFIDDESTWNETSDPYFKLIDSEEVCVNIMREFNLDASRGHIINGHVPVQVRKGENPVKGNGKALVIDGGFNKTYHKKTGISGYTLVSNSRGMRLLQHQKIADVRTALKENRDIESVSNTVELQNYRTTIGDTDFGQSIKDDIADLQQLLTAYQNGSIKPLR
ncbi:MAG: fructose-1,6-bisphosphatase [Selenomonadaceae bacterium]|nr:fructose-1,6-bisphosphatase [Selenomonadaceae bacterium]